MIIYIYNNEEFDYLSKGESLIRAIKDEDAAKAASILNDDPNSARQVSPVTLETPLHVAAKNGLSDFVRLVTSQGNPDFSAKDANGDDLLKAALSSGDEETVGLIYEAMEIHAPFLLNNMPEPY